MLFKFKFLFRKKKNRKIDMYDISDEDLSSIILKGAIIVDVRSPQEYEEGQMEGAILLREYDIKKKSRENFYYIGKVKEVLNPKEIVNYKGNSVVEYELLLKDEIEENLYNYLLEK